MCFILDAYKCMYTVFTTIKAKNKLGGGNNSLSLAKVIYYKRV